MHSPTFDILRVGKESRKRGEGATWEDDGDLRGNNVLDAKWKVFPKAGLINCVTWLINDLGSSKRRLSVTSTRAVSVEY